MQQEFYLKRLEGLAQKQSARFFVIDQLRRQGFRVRDNLPSIHQARKELRDDHGMWTDPTRSKRLEDALKGYSLEERVLLVLSNVWGLTYKELAFVLGLSEWKVAETMKALDL